MVSFLSLALFSLFIQKHIVSSQSTPYEIRFTSPSADGNAITLQCSGAHGSQVTGASFYRNGQNITNSSCLTATPTSSSSELRIELQSQECDGLFSCGGNDILSPFEEFHACPVKNVTETTTVEIEEGSSVLLTCNFFPSPIKNYTTTWFIGIGSNARPIQNSTSEHLQSYLLQKPDQPNSYYCRIEIQSSTNSRCSPSDISSIILVRLKKKYEMPTITEDLDYTMNDNGDGVFSVTSHGTNLTHKWCKDGGPINSTGDGILEISDTSLRVKEINGSLRIAYVVSNVDYDNAPHSMRQTFGVYSRVLESCTTPNESCMTPPSQSCTTPSGVTEDTMEIIIKVVIPVMGVIIFLILCFCGICAIHLWIKNKSCNKMEQLGYKAMKIVKHCNTDKDFLKLLKKFLNEASVKEEYNSECRKFCDDMIQHISGMIIPMPEQQVMDGGTEINSIALHETIGDDHQNLNAEYHEIKEILEKIANKCPQKKKSA